MKLTALTSALLVTVASAHTILDEIYVNGVSQGLHNCLRLPSYDGPITDVTSGDLTCNGGPNPLILISPNKCSMAAGAQLGLRWGETLTSDGTSVIDPSHKGPIQIYMAKVADAVASTPPVSGWFKIYSAGLSNGVWAVDTLIANAGILTITLPTCIAPGDYLVRGELIALHAASTYPGAQFYIECAQVTITGGGSASPATVSIPGAYAGTDPGITYNLYAGQTTYTAPGPAVFSCSGGGSPATSATVKTTSTSTTVKVSTASSSAPAASSSSSAGTAAHYAQCGGTGWTGATACVSPYTCTYSSAYYSQCL